MNGRTSARTEPRKAPSLGIKARVLARQATCPRCSKPLGELEGVQFDHVVLHALGGEPGPDNLQALHADCHKLKTSGRYGASKLSIRDGDAAKVAKVKRIAASEMERRGGVRFVSIESAKPKPKRKIPGRPFPKPKDSK